MRMLTMAALLMLPAVAFATAGAGITPVQAQSAPVQTEQTPAQADQTRAQDQSRAEDVKIGRDWKAQEGEPSHAAGAGSKDHETVGRDWRAHPEKQDR